MSWELRLGFSAFEGRAGVPDLDVWTLSANLRHVFWEDGPWGLSVNGGGGLYAFDPGDVEGGYNLGLGLARELAGGTTLQATYDYHATFTASPDVEFAEALVGVLWSF